MPGPGGAGLGRIGSLLVLTILLAPVGTILLIIAMHKLSKSLNDRLIWKYTLYSLVIGIASIGALIPTSILLATYLGVNALSNTPPTLAYNIAYIITLVVLYPFAIGSGYYWRRAFTELARASGIERFGTTARWVWYGALTSIVPIIGTVFSWVGYYNAYKGFKTLECGPQAPGAPGV